MFYHFLGLTITAVRLLNASDILKEDDFVKNLVCYEYSQEEPDFNNIKTCTEGNSNFDLKSCPPGYHKISNKNNEYCYQTSESSAWDYPCFKSGGASVITDFSAEEIDSLFNSLRENNMSTYYWLPAQRQKIFNPVVWYIPGPNWGRQFEYSSTVTMYTSLLKNCLVLDVAQRMITTEVCTKKFPSLCFYLNDLQYPAKCPEGYHSFRFMSDVGKCYGIEQSDESTAMTYDEFVQGKCANPMGQGLDRDSDITRFIYKKIAVMTGLDHDWCWFGTPLKINRNLDAPLGPDESYNVSTSFEKSFETIINAKGSLAYTNTYSVLSCMACEAEMIYAQEETAFSLEYGHAESILFLTVYYPSALWKYDEQDTGIQCFSDAKGFKKVIDSNFEEIEYNDTNNMINLSDDNDFDVERVTYKIKPVTDRTAQYWCEGHTKNFSLVSTNKVVVNPQGDKLHVFALVVQYHICSDDEGQDLPNIPNVLDLTASIESALQAEKVLLMDVLQYNVTNMLLLVHLHVRIGSNFQNIVDNIVDTYDTLKSRAEQQLNNFNMTFVNISSSLYCLPTTSVDYIILDWEMTGIGHTVSSKQFCLQDNGLPVTRSCDGSYLLGGVWSDVAGHCNNSFEPSNTTTFLYKFVKGEISENITSRFLTEGLSFVLNDVEIIIPADIYYLALSLKHVLNIAEENNTSIDMGDIDNIAWVMDRILALDNGYLRLAQSLNSTNVILDSTDEIMKIIAKLNLHISKKQPQLKYYLSVKPQFVVQISYPGDNNISGIAISGHPECDTFEKMVIQPLFTNSTLDSVMSIDDLVIASWLPEKILKGLKKNCNETGTNENSANTDDEIHIITSIYYNDVVFQQLDPSNRVVNSRIIGISVPGFMTSLQHPIPLIFKQISSSNFSRRCGFWDFQKQQSGDSPGFWDDTGCYFVKAIEGLTLCQCYHMTHFGQLLDFGEKLRPGRENEKHGRALNIITLVGCFLSLVGVVGIWLTAVVFRTWRKKAGTKVLLQLSTSVALPLIFIVVFNLDDSLFIEDRGEYFVSDGMKGVCIALGAFLHYSILASFVWMLITAILQFVRYVRVLGVCRPSRFMIKFTLIGWGIPLLPVILVLVIDQENYLPGASSSSSGKGPICYPSGIYFFIGVLLPIVLVLLINVILFVLVIYSISRGPDGKMRSNDMDLVGAQFRLSIFLFFLLGLTWVFGLISFSGNLLWSYLFCLTSTLQGFVLFIYFIVCDPTTRKLWVSLMKPPLRGTPRDSITSLGLSSS